MVEENCPSYKGRNEVGNLHIAADSSVDAAHPFRSARRGSILDSLKYRMRAAREAVHGHSAPAENVDWHVRYKRKYGLIFDRQTGSIAGLYVPIINDLVNDEVRSRWLIVLTFAMALSTVILFIGQAVFPASPPSLPSQVLKLSVLPAEVHPEEPFFLSVAVLSAFEMAVEGANVSVSLVPVSVPFPDASLVGNLDVTAVPRGSIEDEALNGVRVPTLEYQATKEFGVMENDGNLQLVTDPVGQCDFHLNIARGVPGTYNLFVTATSERNRHAKELNNTATALFGTIKISSDVVSLRILDSTSVQPLSTGLRVPFPVQPVIQVMGANGQPIKGRRVFARLMTPDNLSNGRRFLAGGLSGNVSLESNARGFAAFASLAVHQALWPTVYVAFECDGRFVKWYREYETGISIKFGGMPSVALASEIPTTIEEGQPMPAMEVSCIFGGRAANGHAVYAIMTSARGADTSQSGRSPFASAKTILHSWNQTNDKGIASFSQLTWTATGASGKHGFSFVCEGGRSREVLVDVTTSVGTVKLRTNLGDEDQPLLPSYLGGSQPFLAVSTQSPLILASQPSQILYSVNSKSGFPMANKPLFAIAEPPTAVDLRWISFPSENTVVSTDSGGLAAFLFQAFPKQDSNVSEVKIYVVCDGVKSAPIRAAVKFWAPADGMSSAPDISKLPRPLKLFYTEGYEYSIPPFAVSLMNQPYPQPCSQVNMSATVSDRYRTQPISDGVNYGPWKGICFSLAAIFRHYQRTYSYTSLSRTDFKSSSEFATPIAWMNMTSFSEETFQFLVTDFTGRISQPVHGQNGGTPFIQGYALSPPANQGRQWFTEAGVPAELAFSQEPLTTADDGMLVKLKTISGPSQTAIIPFPRPAVVINFGQFFSTGREAIVGLNPDLGYFMPIIDLTFTNRQQVINNNQGVSYLKAEQSSNTAIFKVSVDNDETRSGHLISCFLASSCGQEQKFTYENSQVSRRRDSKRIIASKRSNLHYCSEPSPPVMLYNFEIAHVRSTVSTCHFCGEQFIELLLSIPNVPVRRIDSVQEQILRLRPLSPRVCDDQGFPSYVGRIFGLDSDSMSSWRSLASYSAAINPYDSITVSEGYDFVFPFNASSAKSQVPYSPLSNNGMSNLFAGINIGSTNSVGQLSIDNLDSLIPNHMPGSYSFTCTSKMSRSSATIAIEKASLVGEVSLMGDFPSHVAPFRVWTSSPVVRVSNGSGIPVAGQFVELAAFINGRKYDVGRYTGNIDIYENGDKSKILSTPRIRAGAWGPTDDNGIVKLENITLMDAPSTLLSYGDLGWKSTFSPNGMQQDVYVRLQAIYAKGSNYEVSSKVWPADGGSKLVNPSSCSVIRPPPSEMTVGTAVQKHRAPEIFHSRNSELLEVIALHHSASASAATLFGREVPVNSSIASVMGRAVLSSASSQVLTSSATREHFDSLPFIRFESAETLIGANGRATFSDLYIPSSANQNLTNLAMLSMSVSGTKCQFLPNQQDMTSLTQEFPVTVSAVPATLSATLLGGEIVNRTIKATVGLPFETVVVLQAKDVHGEIIPEVTIQAYLINSNAKLSAAGADQLRMVTTKYSGASAIAAFLFTFDSAENGEYEISFVTMGPVGGQAVKLDQSQIVKVNVTNPITINVDKTKANLIEYLQSTTIFDLILGGTTKPCAHSYWLEHYKKVGNVTVCIESKSGQTFDVEGVQITLHSNNTQLQISSQLCATNVSGCCLIDSVRVTGVQGAYQNSELYVQALGVKQSVKNVCADNPFQSNAALLEKWQIIIILFMAISAPIFRISSPDTQRAELMLVIVALAVLFATWSTVFFTGLFGSTLPPSENVISLSVLSAGCTALLYLVTCFTWWVQKRRIRFVWSQLASFNEGLIEDKKNPLAESSDSQSPASSSLGVMLGRLKPRFKGKERPITVLEWLESSASEGMPVDTLEGRIAMLRLQLTRISPRDYVSVRLKHSGELVRRLINYSAQDIVARTAFTSRYNGMTLFRFLEEQQRRAGQRDALAQARLDLAKSQVAGSKHEQSREVSSLKAEGQEVSISDSRARLAQFRSMLQRRFATSPHSVFEGITDFYFPTRFLVAMVLTVVILWFGCCIAAAITTSILSAAKTMRLNALVFGGKIVHAAESFETTLAGVRKAAGLAPSVAQQLQGSLDNIQDSRFPFSDLTALSSSTLAKLREQVASASEIASQVRSASESAVVEMMIQSATRVNSTLVFVRASTKDFVELESIVKSSSTAAMVVGILQVWASMLLMINLYRKRIMQLRQGQYFFDKNSFAVSSANKFVAYHIMTVLLGFLFFWFIIWMVFTGIGIIFAYPSVFHRVRRHFQGPAISIALISTITTVVYKLLSSYFLIKRGWIVHPRIFSLFDYFFTWFNIATGIVVAISRLLVSFILLTLFFVRTDLSTAPSVVSSLDPAYHSYIGMLLLDHQSNNPIKIVFCAMMLSRMKMARRIGKLRMFGYSHLAGSRRSRWAILCRACCFFVPMNESEALAQGIAKSDIGAQLELTSLEGAHKHTENTMKFPDDSTAQGLIVEVESGESQAAAKLDRNPSTVIVKESYKRYRRVQNRFWLAWMLHKNPSLRDYRSHRLQDLNSKFEKLKEEEDMMNGTLDTDVVTVLGIGVGIGAVTTLA